MNKSQSPQERLQAWFDNPDTPQDAWRTWTFKQIETDAGASVSSILKHLPDIVEARYPEIKGYSLFRQARQEAGESDRKKGIPISEKDVVRIKTLRLTKTIHETCEITGFSPTTVQRYSSSKPRKRK